MEKKKLDILVTFFNQEKYVDAALNSIFMQKCDFDFNVIIGDDGSTDSTMIQIEKWREKYPNNIFVFQMARDVTKHYIGGFRASQNRLFLLEKVVSDYFIFLDGDDFYLSSNKFQKQIDILEKKENSDCVACAHSILLLFEDGKTITQPSNSIPEGKYTLKAYWKDKYFHTDTIVVRSRIIANIDKKKILNEFNDNLITFIILNYGKIYYFKETMSVYLQTNDGIWTGNKKSTNLLRNILLFDSVIAINKKHKIKTYIRFSSTWKSLFINRKNLSTNQKQELLLEAETNGYTNAVLWLNFASLKKSIRLKLYYKTFLALFLYYSDKIIRIFLSPKKFIKKLYNIIKLKKLQLKYISFRNMENGFFIDLNKENELGIELCKTYKNNDAIITIISDDGDYITGLNLNELSIKYNIPITIAGTVKNIDNNIKNWKEILNTNKNLEIVNHSYNHIAITKEKTKKKFLKHEIMDSSRYFYKKLGIFNISFVPPENKMNEKGYEIIKESTILGMRQGVRGFNEIYPKNGINPGEMLNLKCYGINDFVGEKGKEYSKQKVKEAIEEKKWLIEMWHNVVTNDMTLEGYQTIYNIEADNHMKFLTECQEKYNVWIAKFTDVLKYKFEYENAKVISYIIDNFLCIYIYIDDKRFNCKLTAKLSKTIISLDKNDINNVNLSQDSKYYYFDILPNKLYKYKLEFK